MLCEDWHLIVPITVVLSYRAKRLREDLGGCRGPTQPVLQKQNALGGRGPSGLQTALFLAGARREQLDAGIVRCERENFAKWGSDRLLPAARPLCLCFPMLFRLQVLDEFIRLFFGNFSRESVVFLNFADELLALSVDDVQIIVRKLAPLFFHLAFRLLPLALDLIPVHLGLRCFRSFAARW
jgi:hypothetical protein